MGSACFSDVASGRRLRQPLKPGQLAAVTFARLRVMDIDEADLQQLFASQLQRWNSTPPLLAIWLA